MTAVRTYQIDPSRSVLELRSGEATLPANGSGFGRLSGTAVFNDQDPSRCLIRLRSDCPLEIRFSSWRFKRIGDREYWAPGALAIRGLTVVTSLRVHGPVPEVTDGHGNVRSGAVADVTVRAEDICVKSVVGEVTLSFRIELVRRLPAQGDSVAA